MKRAILLIVFAALFVIASRYYANVKRLRVLEEQRLQNDIKAVEMEVFRMASEQTKSVFDHRFSDGEFTEK